MFNGDDRFSNREPRLPQRNGGGYGGQPDPNDPGGVPNHEVHGGPIDPHHPPHNPPPAQNPGNNDVDVMPPDAIGDIPPPPIPLPPMTPSAPLPTPGIPGTLAQPGSRGAMPFRSNAFNAQSPRFGPGAPMVGGAGAQVSGLGDTGLGAPDDVAELLRMLAAGHASGGQIQ